MLFKAVLHLTLFMVVCYHGHTFVPTGLAPELDDQDPVILLAVKYRQQVQEQIQTTPALPAPLVSLLFAAANNQALCPVWCLPTQSTQAKLCLLMSRQL